MPNPDASEPAPPGDGLLIVDKPSGMTSHDVVARARRLLGTRKIGHAGTLDPMATGVLVLGVGKATRLLTYLVGADKTYLATIRLGIATITDDAEGEPVSASGCGELDDDALAERIAALTGEIEQVPSAVSAIKVDGKRSYARVRAGEDVDLPARPVTVHEFAVLDRRAGDAGGLPVIDLDVRVTCSSGTYIRALARDLGSGLGVGGHLTALRRTTVGPYGLSVAVVLGDRRPELLDLTEAARRLLPVRELTAEETRDAGHGKRLAADGRTGTLAAFAPDGVLVAIIEQDERGARPVVVVRPA